MMPSNIVGVLAFAMCATIALSKNCCFPMKFESGMYITRGTNYKAMQSIAYDYNAGKVAANVTSFGPGGRRPRRTNVIVNYNTRNMYILDVHTQKCAKIKVKEGKRKPCIPDSFTLRGSFHYGSRGEMLSTNMYVSPSKEATIIGVTQRKCYPIYVQTHQFDAHRHEMVAYMNMTIGVRTPSVFSLPAPCRKATLQNHTRIYGRPLLVWPL